MFSTAMHNHMAAEREGRPAPDRFQTTPAAIMQRAQAVFAANRTPMFRGVLSETLASMQLLVARHSVQSQGQQFPDKASAEVLATALQSSLGFMQATVALNYDDALVCHDAFGNVPLNDRQRAIFDRIPALRAWDAARQAKAAAIDAGNATRAADLQAAMEADAAELERQAPARLLADLHARGVALAVDRSGAIVASPAASLLDEHLAALRQHKPAVVDLLRAQAEAAKPVVVA